MKFLQSASLFAVVSALTSLASASSVISKRSDADGLLQFGYNPPRVNPDYCVGKACMLTYCRCKLQILTIRCLIGVKIVSPTYPGLAFQNGSISQVVWEVDEDIPNTPNIVTRIRVLNSTQHNHLVVGENFRKQMAD